jgi:hypothetical protein
MKELKGSAKDGAETLLLAAVVVLAILAVLRLFR